MLEQLQFHKIGVGVPQFNAYRDRDAIKHLLRIAGDLEPLYIGEPYGLKKLTEALGIAQDGSAAGPILSHLFDHAIHTGRRIQAETQIGGRTKYLSRAALGVIGQRHWEMIQGNLLIVGASDVAHLAAQALAEHTAQPTATINRTAAQTETMRRQVSGQTFSWHQMRSALAWADVVVTAGSALYPIVDTEDLAAVLPLRRGRALLLIDLGQPRNVHPAIKGMDTIIYYNLRDLQSLLTELARRAVRDDPGEPWVGSLPKIEQMVQEETQFVWDSLKHASGRILPA
jgi:glutamyl-tRNA reductase